MENEFRKSIAVTHACTNDQYLKINIWQISIKSKFFEGSNNSCKILIRKNEIIKKFNKSCVYDLYTEICEKFSIEKKKKYFAFGYVEPHVP